MAIFIKLTDFRGEPTFVNFELVSDFYYSNKESMTIIVFDEQYIEKVKESLEDIKRKLGTLGVMFN